MGFTVLKDQCMNTQEWAQKSKEESIPFPIKPLQRPSTPWLMASHLHPYNGHGTSSNIWFSLSCLSLHVWGPRDYIGPIWMTQGTLTTRTLNLLTCPSFAVQGITVHVFCYSAHDSAQHFLLHVWMGVLSSTILQFLLGSPSSQPV